MFGWLRRRKAKKPRGSLLNPHTAEEILLFIDSQGGKEVCVHSKRGEVTVEYEMEWGDLVVQHTWSQKIEGNVLEQVKEQFWARQAFIADAGA